MFSFPVKNEIMEECWKVVNRKNFGNRGFFDGSKISQFVGLIGEVAILQIFGKQKDFDGFDGGYDLEHNGLKIDIKTMGRIRPVKSFYVYNLLEVQFNSFDPDVYIISSLNKNNRTLTVCGWIFHDDVPEASTFKPAGSETIRSDGTVLKITTAGYELPMNKLNPVYGELDLLNISRKER